MKSIRRQLLLGTACATVVIFTTAAASLYLLSRQFLIADFDATLKGRIQIVASMTEFDLKESRLDAEDAMQLPGFRGGKDVEYFEVTSDDGQHVLLSPSLNNRRIDRSGLANRGASASFVRLPDGRPGRVMIIHARTQPNESTPDVS
ncbi:MAG: hypothetical protein ACREJC_05410, partial [Tepidisphaeraceae bacterium]